MGLVNFLVVLCDDSTDKSSTEQEVLYLIFTSPETYLPGLKFLCIIGSSVSQDAPRLKQPITDCFKENSLESALEKIVFFPVVSTLIRPCISSMGNWGHQDMRKNTYKQKIQAKTN